MRIVYTVLNGRVAGGQVVCASILRAARSRGDDVCLVSPSHGELTEQLGREGVPVRLLPLERTFRIDAAWRLARWLTRWHADLLHCHGFVAGSILARLAGRIAGVPVICHLHAHPTYSRRKLVRMVQLSLDRATAARAVFVVVAAGIVESLRPYGLPYGDIRVIPNGVDVPSGERCENVSFTPQPVSARQRDPTVLYVGRLSVQKGLEDLLQAASICARDRPSMRFLVVGADHEHGGAYQRRLEELAATLGIAGNVRFLGYRSDIHSLMKSCDVFVLPSHREAFPVTILEAMAAGRPVVATSVGAVPEIVVHGETGLLVPPHSPAELGRAIAELSEDRTRAAQMGCQGRTRVQTRYSLDVALERIWAVYREATGGAADRL